IFSLLDHVFFDRLHGDAFGLEPGDRPGHFGFLAVDLQRHQAHLRGDRRAANVEHHVEALRQRAQDRFFDLLPGEGEIDTLAHGLLFGTGCHGRQIENSRLPTAMRSRQPTQRLVVRYLSPKSGKIVTRVPERSLRATFIAANIAAPEDCPTSTPSSWLRRYTIE